MLKVTANAAAFPNDVDTGVSTIQVPENVTSTLHYSFIYKHPITVIVTILA